jgi:hypothetical protein
MRLSLAYGIVCLNKRLTYITNNVLTSKHECKFDVFALDLHKPKRLANWIVQRVLFQTSSK